MDLAERARATSDTPVVRVRGGAVERGSDTVAGEEPLEIRIGGERLAVTMRTPIPGQDAELALGFLVGEGIAGIDDVGRISECRSEGGEGGVADVLLRPSHPYTLGMLASTVHGQPRGIDIEAIPGAPPDLRRPIVGCSFAPRCKFAAAACGEILPPPVRSGGGYACCLSAGQSPGAWRSSPPPRSSARSSQSAAACTSTAPGRRAASTRNHDVASAVP